MKSIMVGGEMGSRGARRGGKTRLGQIHRLKSTGKNI